MSIKSRAQKAYQEILKHLTEGIIPFWTNNSIDTEFGGYLTCFDENGKIKEDKSKYIVTQTRMVWGFSAMCEKFPENKKLLECAKQGYEFFVKYFWDEKLGGWYWKTAQDGTLLDNGKVVYGQSFAIYTLAQYYLACGDRTALEYAEKTFDLLQKYCTDTLSGGYFENLENDWSISEPGFAAGDRKSLDIHMHIMEAYTTLYLATGKEIHRRKLLESINIILEKMVNMEHGCGLNQFDLKFKPIPAINIRRTWNAERDTGEVIETPTDTTSYGHNVELAWLLNRASDVLGYEEGRYNHVVKKLTDHALKFGFDYELGGVYRDGLHNDKPLVLDKEWWQNCEVLVGFLDAYNRIGDEKYFVAFEKTWEFDKKYMINHELGEWRQLLKKDGSIIIDDIGNPWKGIYHTGRSMLECCNFLNKITNKS